ncbi:MAG: HAD family hydrolase [Acidimicrobiales bacterium]
MTGEPIAGVFFDFAGTLFDVRDLRDVHLRQLRFVAAEAGVHVPDDELRAAYRRAAAQAYRSVANRPAYRHRALFAATFRAMTADLGAEIDDATAQEAVDRQCRATIDGAALRPDCLETLAALRRAAVHVQIVSNIDDEQFDPMLDRLGLRDVVDAVTSSEQAHSCKPDPAIYRIALGKAGIGPSSGLFVGDSPHHDVIGPASIGMRTAWLAPHAGADPGDARPDTVIDALGDVLEIVGAGALR